MIAASKIWKIGRLDIKSAFLQGQKIERDVYLKPLKEAGTDRLWKLNKTVYGLGDPLRRWYFRVKDELRALGPKAVSMMKPYSFGNMKES